MKEMKTEITEIIESVMENAIEFANGFDGYSYLWLDDSQSYLAQFLAYGRQLSLDEMDLVASNDPSQPPLNVPKINDFKEQVRNYLKSRDF